MADTRSLITTRPQCAPCPRCGRLQLTGHAEGLAYRVDPAPVTPHGELAALRSGRRSYGLIADGLAYRDAARIAGDARRPRPPVLPAHRCESPPEPWCVDAAHVETVARLVERARQSDNEPRPEPLTEAEWSALFTLSRELGARVRAAEPPF